MLKYENLYINEKIKNKYVENCKKESLKNVSLKAKEVDNGIILPAESDNAGKTLWGIGGVINKEKKFVKESASRYLFGGNYEIYDDDIKYIDETVIFLGPYVEHWGHFICDQISRLWFLLDNPKKYRIAYCGWDWHQEKKNKISGNFLQLLQMLGIDEEQLINITIPMQFKKILIPDFSFIPGEFYTKDFVNILDKIVANALEKSKIQNIQPIDKIFFTRQNYMDATSKEYGEKDLVNIFKENGYKVLSPEKLSLIEQVYYFNNAKYIVSIAGSITHNLMFCRNKNVKCIILNKINLVNDYQMAIDHITNSQITYIDVYRPFKQVLFGAGPFVLEKTKYLEMYINDNNLVNPKIPKNILKKYMWFNKMYRIIYSDPIKRKWLRETKIF